jgi:excisionase family DNA binding protein
MELERRRQVATDVKVNISKDNSLSGSSLLVELLTVAEAAAFLTISKSGIRRLQQARQLPFIKVRGSVRFAKRDLLTYLAKRMIATLDP